jgi:hypothetical protein
MNSDRTNAYGRVVKTLDDIGPAKLQRAELERVRDVADTLIFASTREEAAIALMDLRDLTEHLLASGRWTEERVDQLLRDVEDCGPVAPVG